MKNEANIVFIEMVRKATQKKRLSETNFKVKYLKQSKKETSTVSKVITKTNKQKSTKRNSKLKFK